jgi:hypothetical protein
MRQMTRFCMYSKFTVLGSPPACYGNSLGSKPDISQKYKMGYISKGGTNTIYPAKKYT